MHKANEIQNARSSFIQWRVKLSLWYYRMNTIGCLQNMIYKSIDVPPNESIYPTVYDYNENRIIKAIQCKRKRSNQ